MKRASITGKSYLTVWVMIFLWAVTMPALAQTQSAPERKISGSVTAGETGSPVPGASITIKGTKRMTTSDGAGNFSIPASPGEVVNVASMGFITRELKVGTSASINIVMQEDYRKLNDVVVVGYGKMKKNRPEQCAGIYYLH